MAKIKVQDTEISVVSFKEQDYISLTDMANAKESESRAADIIKNWLRNRYTIEFLGTWEMIHNPYFKVVEFDHFGMQAGLPNFVLSVSEWIENVSHDIFHTVSEKSENVLDSIVTCAPIRLP